MSPSMASESPPKSPRVVFFLEGRNVPSSRYRVEQYESELSRNRIPFSKCYSWPAKFSHYPKILANSWLRYPVAAIATLLMVVTRLLQGLVFIPGAAAIVFQRDLLHGVPSAALERVLVAWAHWCGRKARIVFDVDDAIFLDRRTGQRGLAKKVQTIASLSDTVLAGNQYLADHLVSRSTRVIPTVLDIKRFPVKRPEMFSVADQPLVLGWTGSRSTSAYLELIAKPLEKFIRETASRLILLCEEGSQLLSNVPNTLIVPWSRETEVSTLLQFDVGLMPLPDDEWSKGKCGLKLLQYGAVGIPSIASPVGVNTQIVLPDRTGLFATSEDEWYQAFRKLHAERSKLPTMGAHARRTVESNYSVDAHANEWLAAILGQSLARISHESVDS